MSQPGWVSIHRKIWECDIWLDDEPFDKRSAWIDMLLKANHETKSIVIGNQRVTVEKGSFVTSQSKLAARWHWGIGRTRRYLDLLQECGMITWTAERKWTVIKVLKYEVYQSENVLSGTITERKRNDSGMIAESNNNVNNENNVNNNNAAAEGELSTELKTIVDNYQHHLKRLVTGPILADLKELLELYGEYAVCTAIQKAKKAKTANINYIRVTAAGVAAGNDFDNKPRKQTKGNDASAAFKEFMKEENWDDYGFN